MSEETLFELALRTPEAERSALLDRACEGQPEFRQRVEALLKADAASAPLLESSTTPQLTPPSFDATTADYKQVDTPGTIIGPYKLLQKLGEGGMGTVWVAEQEQPVKRRVALKLVKAGMDSAQVLRRFEAERQALAMMDHTNIAKVFDAGTTTTGRPYFVMELVKGVPITKYCDEVHASIQDRLELFIQVCSAVQHAHQKGVIHRDIKPSNVLIAMQDGKPVPKVIDFGVAKALHTKLADQTMYTEIGQIIGTLEYMSPEQAELSAMDIDTRADIYALGVLLYELLTGSTPLTRERMKSAAFVEVIRLIKEEEPQRPSTRLSESKASLASLATLRRTDPKKLSSTMRGELDWVVMKALEKDRTRRYETANGLARDIQRYLADEVVEARAPTAGYRLKKFVRRNVGKVIAASLVLGALLLGIVGTTWGLFRANAAAEGERVAKVAAEEQQRRAENGEKLAGERLVQVEAEKKKAEEEKQIAKAVKDFLQKKLLGQAGVRAQANALLNAGGQSAEAKNNPTIRELLDRAAIELSETKIEASFPNQPLLQAEILQTVGNAYEELGEAEHAIRFLQRSLELRKTHLGKEHSEVLDIEIDLAKAFITSQKPENAVMLLEETLKTRKAKLGPDHPERLESMNGLAVAYLHADKLDMALPLFLETLNLRKVKLGTNHVDTQISMNNLGTAYEATEDADKQNLAVPLFEEVLKLVIARLGPEHPDSLMAKYNLAFAYHAVRKVDLALPMYEEVYHLQRTKLGPEHPETLLVMVNLASAYGDSGNLDRAISLFEEARKLSVAKVGPEHPQTLSIVNHLALAYRKSKKLVLALPLFEETLRLRKARLGPIHSDTLHSMSNLANAYRAADKLSLAISLHADTLKLRIDKLGPIHRDTINTMRWLAMSYRQNKQLDKSIPLFEECVKRQQKKLGRGHPDTLSTLEDLGVNYMEAGRLDEATSLFDEILVVRKSKLGIDHPDTLLTLNDRAVSFWFKKQLDTSIPLFEECLNLREKNSDESIKTHSLHYMT